eukprot:UN03411
MVIDEGENLLATMDLIHLFVELLERKYVNVCEYDIIFEPQEAYYVLEDLIVNGLVSDINLNRLTKEMFGCEKYEILSEQSKDKKTLLKSCHNR